MLPFKFCMSLKLNAFNGIGVISSWSQNMSTMVTAASKGRKIDIGSIEQKMDLPARPKKPYTPYIMYMLERKTTLMETRPGVSVVPLVKIISREWKNIDRTKYVEAYENAHKEYKKKIEDYENSLTPEQKDYLKLKTDLQRQHNAFKELKKVCPPPRQPVNRAAMFAKHMLAKPEYSERMKQSKTAEVFKEIHEMYRLLPDHEKQKYDQLAEEDKLRYHQELDEWYDKIRNDPSVRKSVREQADAYYLNNKSKKL